MRPDKAMETALERMKEALTAIRSVNGDMTPETGRLLSDSEEVVLAALGSLVMNHHEMKARTP